MVETPLREAYHANIPIEKSDRGTRGAAVFVQDQTTEMIGVPMLNGRGFFTLAAPTVRDSYQFTATTGHSIAVGEIIELANSVTFMQAKVLDVTGDLITIDSLINHAYSTGDTGVRSSENMIVDGSVTPQIFSVKPLPGQSGDITRVLLIIEGTGNMDFTTFGSDPSLTRGCLMRVKRKGGDYRNLFNFKSNGEFIAQSFDNVFQQKVGGGLFGFGARTTFNGQDKRGVVVRLDGDIFEELQLVIQDDLTILGAGKNTFMRMEAQGSELQG